MKYNLKNANLENFKTTKVAAQKYNKKMHSKKNIAH